jgi:hypothetical protein
MHVKLVRFSCFNEEHAFDKKMKGKDKNKKDWDPILDFFLKKMGKDKGLGKDTEADSDRIKALCLAILLSPVHHGDGNTEIGNFLCMCVDKFFFYYNAQQTVGSQSCTHRRVDVITE